MATKDNILTSELKSSICNAIARQEYNKLPESEKLKIIKSWQKAVNDSIGKRWYIKNKE